MAAPDGVYSIGAVAAMLDLAPATLRTWEERYKVIFPSRTVAGQRLYSRPQVERLRFIKSEIAHGRSAGDAHRLLAEQARLGGEQDAVSEREGAELRTLVAERDPYSAERIDSLLGPRGFSVDSAFAVDEAKRKFGRRRPQLSVVELLIEGGRGEDLCRWLKARGSSPVLVVSGLAAADRALKAGADAFLAKPIAAVQLLSAVDDLVGVATT